MIDAIGGGAAIPLSAAPAQPVQQTAETATTPAPALAQEGPVKGGSFYSPVFSFDPQTLKTIVEFLDTKTGNVEDQVPNRRELQAYATGNLVHSQELAAGTVSDIKS